MSEVRIAVGGFMHETNTFAPSKADYQAFEHGGGWSGLVEGAAVVTALRSVNMGMGGFVQEADRRCWTLVPTIWCGANPSAHVTEDAFERIVGRLVEGIRAAGPVDGVYLDLHGAMVAEHVDDGEGEVLDRVRAVIGPAVPLVASLDLHANITPRMVEAADALVAYRTYPHVDMADTGRRSAVHLAHLLTGARAAKAFRQLPFLIPIEWQYTGMEPCRGLYAELATLETEPVRTLSFAPGFPAADFEDCGPSVVVYADTQAAADATADRLAARVAAAEAAFAGTAYAPLEGVREAMRLAAGASRPIVLADTQDNPGAGGDGNTTGMVRALVEAGAERAALGLLYDPAAAQAAHAAGPGATVRLDLGGTSGIPGDQPFEATFVVEAVSDGQLIASGPYFGGSHMDLGPCACLRIGGVRIAVGSRKVQMADQAMYRVVGIEPTEQAILVNKSSVHFRADFEPIADAVLVCAAPGPMRVDPATLPFTKLRKGIRLSPKGPAFV